MAAAETANAHYGPSRINPLSAEDFETASIRSAAPSYISDAPSYHSTQLPTYEASAAFRPPAYTPARPQRPVNPTSSVSSLLPPAPATPTPMTSTFSRGAGLPPRQSQSHHSHNATEPSMAAFRMPFASSSSSPATRGNPASRHLHSVASRRAAAASVSTPRGMDSAVEGALRSAISRIGAANAVVAAAEQREQERLRPLEDPYLVGEVAARAARNERLARENGEDILAREDRQWDWFLAQMKDWDERERGWKNFRRDLDNANRSRRFSRRWGR
ncbi:hypothetical protein F4780DRAFT_403679 [Xylariomycetidae sp. FL0641]|nr:hypothetical protein F4780DRAFT_403679 [Xylariomycetidae sp. FL0641]